MSLSAPLPPPRRSCVIPGAAGGGDAGSPSLGGAEPGGRRQKLVLEGRAKGWELGEAELGMEREQEVSPGGFGDGQWVVGDVLVSPGGWRWSTRPRGSPEPALCLDFPVCEVSTIAGKCCKRAGRGSALGTVSRHPSEPSPKVIKATIVPAKSVLGGDRRTGRSRTWGISDVAHPPQTPPSSKRLTQRLF